MSAMASTILGVFALSGCLLSVTTIDDDCFFRTDKDCADFNSEMNSITIASVIVTAIIIIFLIITCCVCPCCCLYKLCRKPRPVMATHTTTVVTSQYPQQQQQPSNPGGQYPPYPSVPAQPGYSAQPGYGGPIAAPYQYQGQPYTPGPPPSYNESVGPRYPAPYSQAAYDGGQLQYPLQPPYAPQQGYVQPVTAADYSGTQPPYNPGYVEPPKTGY